MRWLVYNAPDLVAAFVVSRLGFPVILGGTEGG